MTDDRKKHAEWCNLNIFDPGEDGYHCDCGGDAGACPICGAEGPCGFDGTGFPLICAKRVVKTDA